MAREVTAGLTLAAVGLPAVLGYSLIAGMPLVTGLYTFVLPLLVFALVGTSRHLIVAGDSASAALLAGGLVGVARVGTAHYLIAAEVTAVLVGVILLAVRLLRLTFVSNFLSRTILVGFLAGVGVQVGVTQLPALLGLHQGGSTLVTLWRVAGHIGAARGADLTLGVLGVVVILALRHYVPRVPGAFLVVVAGIGLGWWAARSHPGLTYIEQVRSGLPHPVLGPVPWSHLSRLTETALSIVVVVVAQSAATSRGFAARYGEKVNEGRDIVGLGLANLAAGLSGTYPVNSSPTRAAITEDAGGQTQWPGVVAAGATLVVLVLFTGVLRYLPASVLAAVVFTIAVRLIDVHELGRIARLRRDEFVVALLAAGSVVVLGIENGIFVAALLAIVNHLRRGYAPTNFLVVFEENGMWGNRPVTSGATIAPGVLVYRFQASLWYANVTRLVDEVSGLLDGDHGVTLFCFDFTSVAGVDYSAGTALAVLVRDIEHDGVTVRFSHVDDAVLHQIESYDVVEPGDVRVVRGTRDAIELAD